MRQYKHGAIEQPHINKFREVEWFLFIDDDLYIRPYSLAAMLRTLPQTHPGDSYVKRMKNGPLFYKCQQATRAKDGATTGGHSGCLDFPAAILAPISERSFLFSRRWDRKKYHCLDKRLKLYLAMPAIINKEAMALMRAAVDANGITEMQSIWGGTHDMLLATLLLYKIPLFSVRSVYYGGSMVPISKENMNWVSFDRSKVVVHMLKNFAIPMKRGMNNTRTYKQNSRHA